MAPPLVAHGRSLGDFEPLLPGEQCLLLICRQGVGHSFGTGCPRCVATWPRVRVTFMRFLLLGGDEQAPVHERGVCLWGALVDGALDLLFPTRRRVVGRRLI
jgi:hypothetical protein